ncbi:DUF2530 domain-containing protein [Nocardiopsis sp. CNT-189]|uniref:DUF2530 domain-containing protein n=1 Tax=Nocardiopsis oceanisediminis TaxID=2816862 RepID=UPI003B37A882
MRTPRRPDPEVLEFDYRVPTALGTLGWTAALAALLVWGDGLDPDQRWRVAVCVTGMVLGVFAFFYIPRLLDKRARAEAERSAERAAATAEEAPDPGERPAPAPEAPPGADRPA